jgi:glycoprotein 3-alpha-L-fucosyltransferase
MTKMDFSLSKMNQTSDCHISTTPQLLADYLHQIDNDDCLFNEYFRWRRYGEMINTKTWCRFCSMLHERDLPEVTQNDVDDWWGRSGTCIGVKTEL